MAKLTKIKDARLKGKPVRYRLRYEIYWPDGGISDRSKRYQKITKARGDLEEATILEARTRRRLQSTGDLSLWQSMGLISAEDAERLDLAPPAQKKTLSQAMDEYRATWEVSKGEATTRDGRIKIIEEILGKDTPISDLHIGHGETLKLELKRRDLKTVTIRKYLQDLKRCFRHQVMCQILPYNPFTELSAGRIPQAEKKPNLALTSEQVRVVLKKAEERILKGEENWKVLHGWLPTVLLLLFGTGLRRNEALLAKWEHIDWEKRSILVPAENAKDGERREIGLGGRLYRELSVRKKVAGYILPRYYPSTLTKAVGKHLRACGFAMTLHDTRHTYVTLIQQDAGATPHEAMQRSGHNDMAMLSWYTHAEFSEVLEDRLGFMEDLQEGQTKH